MRDWSVQPLSSIADIRPSNVDKKTVSGESSVRLCNYMDVYGRRYITADLPFMEATASPSEIARFRVSRGDVIVTKDSETPDDIGVPSVVVDDVDDLVCGYHLALLKPRAEIVDSSYLAKQLEGREVARYFGRVASGSTRYGLGSGALGATPIPLAPRAVQPRIAEILSTVDDAIAETEALIAKTQQVKLGLMHDLFTRGIDESGELRPSPGDAPRLFRNSPVGKIPMQWQTATIDELLAQTSCPMRSGPFGSALLKEELVEDGIPLLGIDNVFPERFEATYRRFVSGRKFTELARYAVFPGDVIITIMGTVGRCCVAPPDLGRAMSSKHLWTMTLDHRQVLPDLVCWQLNHAPWVTRWFARHAQGAVMSAIQSSTLRSLILPVPPMDEQERIHGRYIALSASLQSTEDELTNLRALRAGLMQDLLTGRVRVPPRAGDV